jgi:hypothetical protein
MYLARISQHTSQPVNLRHKLPEITDDQLDDPVMISVQGVCHDAATEITRRNADRERPLIGIELRQQLSQGSLRPLTHSFAPL